MELVEGYMDAAEDKIWNEIRKTVHQHNRETRNKIYDTLWKILNRFERPTG